NPHRPYRPSALTLVPLFLRWPDNCGIPDGGGGRLRHTYEIASDNRLGLGYIVPNLRTGSATHDTTRHGKLQARIQLPIYTSIAPSSTIGSNTLYSLSRET